MTNIYDLEVPSTGELFTTLLSCGDISIKHIVSSDSIPDTLYIQDEDEWVLLLEGRAVLDIDGERVSLGRGEHLYIPAHTPHRVLETDMDTRWLAIFITPTQTSTPLP